MKKVIIVDYKLGNLFSVAQACKEVGIDAEISSAKQDVAEADAIILPGVGAAKDIMERIRGHGLIDTIRSLTQPVLGICVGMQILVDASEEEDVECLGIIPGVAKRLEFAPDNAVPNMGWCQVESASDHPALSGLDDGAWFYFLHSYAVPVSEYSLATAQHSSRFTAVIGKDNFVAAQFHPERSSKAGARFLKNFVDGGV